jgi:hypothetical protein
MQRLVDLLLFLSLLFLAVMVVLGIRSYRRRSAKNRQVQSDLWRAAAVGDGFEPDHKAVTDSGRGLLLLDTKSRVVKAGHYLPESDSVFLRTIPVDELARVRVAENFKSGPFDMKREMRDAIISGAMDGRWGVVVSMLLTLLRAKGPRDLCLVLETRDKSDPPVALSFMNAEVGRAHPMHAEALHEAHRWKSLIEGLRDPAARAA